MLFDNRGDRTMKKIFMILSLAVFLMSARVFAADSCGTAAKADDNPIETRAKELVAGKNTRLEKISAIYSFVRNEIGQAKTQYG